MIKLYDKVKLKSGEVATIVEILDKSEAFVADIEKKDGTDTDFIYSEQIEKVID